MNPFGAMHRPESVKAALELCKMAKMHKLPPALRTPRLPSHSQRFASTIDAPTPSRRPRATREEPVSPSADWVGSPSPVSNLRPMRYAPLFPAPASPSPSSSTSDPSSSSESRHPYSLQEFASQPRSFPPKLQVLRDELDAADLQWRLHRQRVDADNEAFWSKVASGFSEYETAADELAVAGPSGTASVDVEGAKDAARDEAYAKWLNDQRVVYKDYNRAWWTTQRGLIIGGWRAQRRAWRWRWECFKAGVEP